MNKRVCIVMLAALAALLPGQTGAQSAQPPAEIFRNICAANGARMNDVLKAARAAGFRRADTPPGMAQKYDRVEALERDSGGAKQVVVVMSGESAFSSKVPAKVPMRACNVTYAGSDWDVRAFAREFTGLAPQLDTGSTALYSYFERPGGNVIEPEDMPGLIAGANAGEMRNLVAVEKDGMRSLAWVVMEKPRQPIALPASHDSDPFAPCRWEDGRNKTRVLSCPDKVGEFSTVGARVEGVTEQTPALARGGDTAAMLLMVRFYTSGPDFARDPASAFAWSKRAAEAGAAGGEFDLGLAYESGTGVAADKTEAARWYRAAADHGHVPAMINLAGMMRTGPDSAAAAALVRRAADSGAAEGQFDMGHLSENGIGVPKDMTEALRWYRLAADAKDTGAMLHLGLIYADGIGGVPRDEAEGARWMVAGVNGVQNIATAIMSIAVSFSGFDNRRAEMIASAQTNPQLAQQLGIYLADPKNPKRDPAAALGLLQIAANARYPLAIQRIGVMYAEGDGVEKNLGEAIKRLRSEDRLRTSGDFRRMTQFAKAP